VTKNGLNFREYFEGQTSIYSMSGQITSPLTGTNDFTMEPKGANTYLAKFYYSNWGYNYTIGIFLTVENQKIKAKSCRYERKTVDTLELGQGKECQMGTNGEDGYTVHGLTIDYIESYNPDGQSVFLGEQYISQTGMKIPGYDPEKHYIKSIDVVMNGGWIGSNQTASVKSIPTANNLMYGPKDQNYIAQFYDGSTYTKGQVFQVTAGGTIEAKYASYREGNVDLSNNMNLNHSAPIATAAHSSGYGIHSVVVKYAELKVSLYPPAIVIGPEPTPPPVHMLTPEVKLYDELVAKKLTLNDLMKGVYVEGVVENNQLNKVALTVSIPELEYTTEVTLADNGRFNFTLTEEILSNNPAMTEIGMFIDKQVEIVAQYLYMDQYGKVSTAQDSFMVKIMSDNDNRKVNLDTLGNDNYITEYEIQNGLEINGNVEGIASVTVITITIPELELVKEVEVTNDSTFSLNISSDILKEAFSKVNDSTYALSIKSVYSNNRFGHGTDEPTKTFSAESNITIALFNEKMIHIFPVTATDFITENDTKKGAYLRGKVVNIAEGETLEIRIDGFSVYTVEIEKDGYFSFPLTKSVLLTMAYLPQEGDVVHTEDITIGVSYNFSNKDSNGLLYLDTINKSYNLKFQHTVYGEPLPTIELDTVQTLN
jgi:hypothetical protein